MTGATGFVGSSILPELLEAGHTLRGLIRPSSHKKDSQRAEERKRLESLCEIIEGDLLSGVEPSWLSGCEAVVHLVGIIVERGSLTFERVHAEATRNLVEASKKAGVKRFLHMSALGASPTALSRYHQTKWKAEEAVKQSGLAYTIFRPSVIIGAGDGFTNLIYDLLHKPLFTPLVGGGQNRLQPISAKDVARAFRHALTDARLSNKTVELGGPRVYTFEEMLDRVASALGRKRAKLKIPLFMMKPLAWAMQTFQKEPELTLDQLKMMQSDNVCAEDGEWKNYFSWERMPFEEALQEALSARAHGIGNISKGQMRKECVFHQEGSRWPSPTIGSTSGGGSSRKNSSRKKSD